MVTPATRQEVQSVVERAVGSIKGNMINKGDLQNVINQIRSGILKDLHAMHAENKSAINQSINHRDQLALRISGIEHAISKIEQSLNYFATQQNKNSEKLQNMKTDNSYLFQRI